MLDPWFHARRGIASRAPIGAGIAVHGDITTEAGAAELLAGCAAAAGPSTSSINNYGTAGRGRWDDADEAALARHVPAQRPVGAAVDSRAAAGDAQPRLGSHHQPRHRRLDAAGGADAALLCREGRARDADDQPRKRSRRRRHTVNLVSPGLIHTAEVEASYLAQGRRNGWGDTWAEIEPRVAADIPIRSHRSARRSRRSGRVPRKSPRRCNPRSEHPHRWRRARRADVTAAPCQRHGLIRLNHCPFRPDRPPSAHRTPSMNFEFSDEQNLLREQAQSFLSDKCPLAAVRRVLDGDEPNDADTVARHDRSRLDRDRDSRGIRRHWPRLPGTVRDRRRARPQPRADAVLIERLSRDRSAARVRHAPSRRTATCRSSPPASGSARSRSPKAPANRRRASRPGPRKAASRAPSCRCPTATSPISRSCWRRKTKNTRRCTSSISTAAA